jgi:hypothetical protein
MKNAPLWIIAALTLAIAVVAQARLPKDDVCPNPDAGPQHPWEICSRAF